MASGPSVCQPWTINVQCLDGRGTSTSSEVAGPLPSTKFPRDRRGRGRGRRRRLSPVEVAARRCRVPAGTGIVDDVDADAGLQRDVDIVRRVVDDGTGSRSPATRPCVAVIEGAGVAERDVVFASPTFPYRTPRRAAESAPAHRERAAHRVAARRST